jgi:secondary thiamine-phosphate synthase enzyme
MTMNKSSVATARPAAMDRSTAATGGGAIVCETLLVSTSGRLEFQDLTEQVLAYVQRSGVKEGIVGLWSTHTTCALFINECQDALLNDLEHFLEGLVPRDRPYRHNDQRFSDCDRLNADAHLRATLLSHSLMLPISDGEVVLGQWQRILLAELDGPRSRALRIQVLGLR